MNDCGLLNFKQIYVLLDVLKNSSFLLIDEIKRKYETYATNFDPTSTFLKELGIIQMSGGKVSLTDDGKVVVSQLAETEEKKKALKENLGRQLFLESSAYKNPINELFIGAKKEGDIYILTSPTPQHLVNLRNLLIELEIIDFNYETQIYSIREVILEKYPESKRFFKLSKQQLDEILKRKDFLGQDAELAILQFEKEKLSANSELVKKIKHVSPVDVGAGYDIESFEDIETKKPIFIEVKAVSIADYEFKWSKNEIKCAEQLGEKYYLYLLPVIAERKLDLDHLKIVKDPIRNILSKEKEWVSEVEALSIKLKSSLG